MTTTTGTALMDTKATMSPAERRAMVLAKVHALKNEGQVYVPYEGGVNYVRLDGNTGNLTFGRDDTEIPAGQRFAVPLDGAMHGVEEWLNQQKLREVKVRYIDGPAPAAPKGAKMQGGGDRNGWVETIDIRIQGVGGELDKVVLEVGCNNESKKQQAINLLGEMSGMCETALGQEGFFNAVIELEVKSYFNKRFSKDIFYPSFKIVGWTDGWTIKELSELEQRAISSAPADMLD